MSPTSGTPDVPALCARFELEPGPAAIARPEHDPPAFVAALLDAEEFAGAVAFLAHSLPKREAVWWAWTCARRTAPEDRPQPVQAALDATERWLAQPSEQSRRPLFDLAQGAGVGTPAGCAALAGFFSGGSLAPAGAQDVPPPEFASAKAITGSIILSAVYPPPEQAPERFRQFIGQGVEVARRIKLWPTA